MPASAAAYGKLLMSSTDWVDFDEFYLAVLQNGTLFEQSGSARSTCRRAPRTASPSSTTGCAPGRSPIAATRLLEREIAVLKDALGDRPASDAFLTTTAPLSVEPGRANGIYKSDEEHIYAIAEAMRVEYEAIAAAGFQVQVDDAWLGALWDRIGLEMGIDGYRKYCQMRCEALNHALRNIPEEQIRYHLCWGSWHGPHSRDLPLPDVIDIMLSVKAQMYLIEAANVRHEHEIVAVGGHQAARRQDPRPGRRDPLDAADRAPAARGGSHPALRRARRTRERHRLHRLRPRPALPPAARMGQAQDAHRRRRARDNRAVELTAPARDTASVVVSRRRR